jgi:translation elongation factor EF-Ts
MTEHTIEVSAEACRQLRQETGMSLMEAKKKLQRDALRENIIRATSVTDLKNCLLQMLEF